MRRRPDTSVICPVCQRVPRTAQREQAARYSCPLAIPAVVASGLLELTQIGDTNAPAWGPTIAATLIAFGVGYATIAWLLRYITTHRFTGFVLYRIALGAAVITLVSLSVIPSR